MKYTEYRFKLIRFQDSSTISRISLPVTAISEKAAIADIENAYGQQVISWEPYVYGIL